MAVGVGAQVALDIARVARGLDCIPLLALLLLGELDGSRLFLRGRSFGCELLLLDDARSLGFLLRLGFGFLSRGEQLLLPGDVAGAPGLGLRRARLLEGDARLLLLALGLLQLL